MRAGVVGRHGTVLALAAAAVALRLPFLGAPEGADEGGYLAVARQWHGAGPSLYGHYWVDRPPLLIALFQVASAFGGMPAVRVLGALAAGVAVLGVADAARRVAGHRAAVWGAALAAALLASPQLGTVQVNGELLAAPFVAWSVACWLRALPQPLDSQPPGELPAKRPGAAPAAFGAGVLAACAVLVKQNMADPIVFGTASALAAAWGTGAVHRSVVRRAAVGAAGGLVTGLVLVGTWTMIRGASLTSVFGAMYPFRVRAAVVLATLPDQGQAQRFGVFMDAWLSSGVLLVVGAFVWATVRRRVPEPVAWGLCALLVWAAASVLLSGGFWDHYLVQLVVPVSVAGGLALGGTGSFRRRELGRLVPALAAAAVVLVALTHWALAWGTKASDRGVGAGTAIAAVAAPGDTVVSLVGDAETVEASGLMSPYPYLWTLPAQVDDPHLTRLIALLNGPGAPTWLVPWNRPSFPPPTRERLAAVVAAHYRAVGAVCGHPLLLRDGVTRGAPPAEPCDVRLARW
ncbi:hypothetical protein [Nocardioides pocheonensis]|uniref:Glycosyltransferase RgtA/B/C/D-like domain-containing protein n=1 Tax=Nocardioides pocheonensis TaxID=661485 RepID=A0A3N0GVY8_9ACTN|nr:hypothetical protein [Nocardioides pocheonensis]RNM16310.1 hypothetical protein EFL26_05010 [Nocardioides pocheonensis]